MQLVPQCSCQAPALKRLLPWADSSTDPSKLRSLLLSPHKLLTVQLYVLGTNTSSSNIAITRDHLRQGGERYEIYGNVAEQPDYEHACEQVIAMSTGNTCRFSALPALAVPTVRAVLTKHGYQELYSSPCWEFILQGPLLELQPPGFREQLQQKLGNQYELSTLQQRDAELVNSLWVYRWVHWFCIQSQETLAAAISAVLVLCAWTARVFVAHNGSSSSNTRSGIL